MRTISLNNPTATALTFNFATNHPMYFKSWILNQVQGTHWPRKEKVPEMAVVIKVHQVRIVIDWWHHGCIIKIHTPKQPISDELEDKFEGDLTVTFANMADQQVQATRVRSEPISSSHRPNIVLVLHVERWKPITLHLSIQRRC